MVAPLVVISKEMIKPSSPTLDHRKNHKLSFLDQLSVNNYIPLIFFYEAKPDCQTDHVQRSQQLKQSLSDVLTKFYPLAGRIDDSLSIDCDDSGVMYVEAHVNADMNTIKATSIEEFSQYLPIDPKGGEGGIRKDILLALQVSFFDCGGIAIGICIYHKIADGSSMFSFMNAWAATCRGDAKILVPDFDSGTHHFPPVNFPGFDLVPDAGNKTEKIVTVKFLFHKDTVAKLKEDASSACGSQVKNPTRVEVVFALIFKHFINSSKPKTEEETKFTALHAVNLRSRMSPPLPEYAFGNLAFTAHATLLPSDDTAYHKLVEKFRNTKTKVNGDYIQGLQNGEAYLGNIMKSIKERPMGKMEICTFTSWCGFPLYDVDYGWGKPFFISISAINQKKLVVLMNTKCGYGIEAWVGMDEDEFKMLPDELRSIAIS